MALLAVGILQGGLFPFAKSALLSTAPNTLTFLRVLGAWLLFLLIEKFFIKGGEVHKQDKPQFFKLAVVGVLITQLVFFQALKLTSPINAALILSLTPACILLMGRKTKEIISPNVVFAIILGMIGVSSLLLSNGVGFGNGVGEFLVLLTSVAFGGYLMLLKPLSLKYAANTIMSYVFGYGTLLLFPFAVYDFIMSGAVLAPSSNSTFFAIGYIIVGPTFLVQLLNAYSMKFLPASTVGSTVFLTPVFAILFAYFLGNDTLTIGKAIGGLVIMSSLYFIQKPLNTRNNSVID